MKLRNLKKVDAPLMLEWMHDADVVKDLQANFASKTLADCEAFIEGSQSSETDLNLAIVDDTDEYMGTVSLKHIDRENKTAEFAITVRSKAMGKGISKYGMQEIIRIGLNEYGLEAIYWCVSIENKRAVRFYEKGEGLRTNQVPKEILNKYDEKLLEKLIWYVVKK